MKFKKISKLLLAVSILFCNVKPIYANEEKSLLDYSTEEVLKMDEGTYYDLLSSYFLESIELEKDHYVMKLELAEVGIEFDGYDEANQNLGRSLTTDISLNAYSSRRSGQSYTYLTGVATTEAVILTPGSEDMMSIEWNPEKGSYYGYTETRNVTLQDYSKRNQGCLAFNVQDVKMQAIGSSALTSVLVSFKNNNDRGRIGISYIHTFKEYSPTLTIGGNVSFKDNNATGGLSISCTISGSNAFWQRSFLSSVNA